MPELMKVHVDNLSGAALAWALDAVDTPPAGQLNFPFCMEADDRRGEALAAKYNVWVEPGHRYPWVSCVTRDPCDRRIGDTRTIAIFRAVVAFKLGNTIEIPKELAS